MGIENLLALGLISRKFAGEMELVLQLMDYSRDPVLGRLSTK